MNAKVIYATLAGGVVSFLLGWLIYGMLLAETMKSSMVSIPGLERDMDHMIWWALVLSQFVWAFVIALIFNRWAGISSWRGGAIGGAWLGGLLTFSIDLGMFSMMNHMTLQWVIIDSVVGVIMGAIIGAVIGWVLGFGKKG